MSEVSRASHYHYVLEVRRFQRGIYIYYAQPKVLSTRSTRIHEGDTWVLEPFSAPSTGGPPSETRKSEIVPNLRMQYGSGKKYMAHKQKLLLDCFKGQGVLLGDPTTGMLIKMEEEFWACSFGARRSVKVPRKIREVVATMR